jgi:hypothetical protein
MLTAIPIILYRTRLISCSSAAILAPLVIAEASYRSSLTFVSVADHEGNDPKPQPSSRGVGSFETSGFSTVVL